MVMVIKRPQCRHDDNIDDNVWDNFPPGHLTTSPPWVNWPPSTETPSYPFSPPFWMNSHLKHEVFNEYDVLFSPGVFMNKLSKAELIVMAQYVLHQNDGGHSLKDIEGENTTTHPHPYIIIVPDAADIVCGANLFMWCSTCSTWQCCLSCGSKLLHVTTNFTPCDKTACRVEKFYHVKQW